MKDAKLSRKQTAILGAYAARHTTAVIVKKLRTTRSSINRHKERICRKLGVHSIAVAIKRVRSSGG